MRMRVLGSLILVGASLAPMSTAQSDQIVTVTKVGTRPRTPDFDCCGAGNTLTVINNFGISITVNFNDGIPIVISPGGSGVFNATFPKNDFYKVLMPPQINQGSERNNCKPGTSAIYNTPPVNPVVMTAAILPHVGKPWSVNLSCAGADPSKLAIFVLGFKSDPALTPVGVRLVSLAPGTFVSFAVPHFGGMVAPVLGMPNDPALGCLEIRVQALCGDSPKGYLTNALDQVIGQ